MNTMKKLLSVILALSLLLSCLASCSKTDNESNEGGASTEADENTQNGKSKKVLLISVDGMRPDALLSSKHADHLIQKATYYTDASTVYPSVTLPCHMSMLHGVGPDSHEVFSNQYTPAEELVDGVAEVVAKSGKSCAFFYNWGPLGDTISDAALTERRYISGETLGWQQANIDTALACKEYLLTNHTDFTVLYLGNLDEVGHANGWLSEEYRAALDESLELVFEILDVLGDEYTVILTSDHGGHDTGHGSTLPEDMTIPIFLIGKSFPTGTQRSGASILDIAPTIADLLGVSPDQSWDGKSLK